MGWFKGEGMRKMCHHNYPTTSLWSHRPQMIEGGEEMEQQGLVEFKTW